MKYGNFVEVAKEYEKNKELKKEDIKLLEEWMAKQSHLPKISELDLILFLHSCYYRIEPTKKCIEIFFTIRTHCPEFFQNRNPAKNSTMLETILFTHLSKPSILGYQIFFAKFVDYNSDNFVLSEQIKNFDMSAMLTLHQTGTAPGHVLLVDLKGMAFGHVTKMNPVMVKKFFVYLQEALPIRLKAIYFINIPSFMDKVLAIIKPFLKKELLDTMQLYTDKYEKLYKLISRDCFPSDYGGEVEPVNELIKKRRENMLANENFFVEDEKLVANESKRVGTAGRNIGDIFGLEGTFKKLDID